MKRFAITLIILLAVCAVFFYALSWPRGLGDERAVGGVLDLTGADFSRTRHNLNGEWEFFFGALYTPEDFAGGAVRDGGVINVPGSWADAGYPLYGSATYRLVVKTNEPSLMMFLTVISNASAVWINGEKVFSAGTVGEQTVQAGGVGNEFISFSPQDGRVEIIVQASNYAFFRSGILTGIEIGRPRPLLNDAIFRRVLLGLFIGVLFAMFIYQLFLFSMRCEEWAHLAFALFCIVTAARFAMETNGLVMLFRDYGHIERSVIQILLALKAVGLVVFTYRFFTISVGKFGLCVYSVSLGIPILTAIFLPFDAVDSRVVFLPMISLAGMILAALRSKRLLSNYYNCLYLNVCFLYIIVQPTERFLLDGQIYMIAATHNLLIVLVQFFMLSLSYSQARESEHRLAAENAALDREKRFREDVLAVVSHEMRTPLAVMSVYAQMAMRQIRGNKVTEQTMTDLETISRETGRLAELSSSALAMFGKKETVKTSVNAGDIAVQLANLLKPGAMKKNTEFEFDLNLPPVWAVPDEITRVFWNLYDNAIIHTENGKITVSGKAENGLVYITIADTGEGMADDIKSTAFESGVSGAGKTGLGLPLCKEIIQAHGGEITIESKPGEGCAVTFCLPVYKETDDE